MKLKMIPAVILASMSVMGVAQAQVSVYGLVDVGFAHTDVDGGAATDKLAFSNNSTTKIGVQGKGDLGKGITGTFQLESGAAVAPIDANVGMFNRQAWVGLAGNLGEVRLGIQDTVAFKTLAPYDLNGAANDTMAAGGILNTVGQNAAFAVAGKELANYISPVMSGFQASVGVTPKGNNTDSSGGTPNMSLGLSYNMGALSAGLAFESSSSNVLGAQTANNYSALAASYDFGVAKLAGEVVNGGNGQRGSQIGLSAPLLGATVGVQYAKNNDTGYNGIEYFINKEVLKNTTAFFEYGLQNTANKTTKYSAGLIYVF